MLKRMLWWLLGAYIALFLFAMFISERVIFQPQPSSYRDNQHIVKLTSAGGVKISAIYLENPQAKYTVLYSHGNAEDIGQNYDYFLEWQRLGFNVLGYNYQGYGTSEGKSSESNAYADEEAAFRLLTEEKKIPAERIIAVGQSLGGAMAIDLAAKHKLGGLIVQSSFTSAFRVLTRWPILPFDKFDSVSKIKRVHCPVLIIHGKKDSVVGFWNSQVLFNSANEPKQKWWVNRGDHNDILLVDAPGYWKAVESFVATLR
jgi:abhydrolase domain-containing protein 17